MTAPASDWSFSSLGRSRSRRGGISRNGDHTGVEATEKRADVFKARGIEQQHAIPGNNVHLLEVGRDDAGAAIEVEVGQSGFFTACAFAQEGEDASAPAQSPRDAATIQPASLRCAGLRLPLELIELQCEVPCPKSFCGPLFAIRPTTPAAHPIAPRSETPGPAHDGWRRSGYVGSRRRGAISETATDDGPGLDPDPPTGLRPLP